MVRSAAFYSEFQTEVRGRPCQGRVNRLSFVRESTVTFNLTTHLVFSLFGIPQSLSFLFILLRTECFCFNTSTVFFYFQRSGKCVCAVLLVFLSHNSLLTKGQILNQNPAFCCHYHILIPKDKDRQRQ